MTYYTFRLTLIALLGCGTLTLLAAGIGCTLPQEEEIAYFSYHNYGIYRTDLARGLTRRISNGKSSLAQPDWSADGERIAFVNNSSAQLTLYVADADGRNTHILTDQPDSSNYDPKWSPDGHSIAYSTSSAIVANGHGPVIEIMLFDTETHSKRRLFTTNIFREHMLYWSPDGTQIAFVLYSTERSNSDIYSINIHTGAIRTLVSTPANDEYPIWSPDGQSLAFVSGLTERGIYLLNLDTERMTRLYTLTEVSYPSDWSQDGRDIILSSLLNVYKLDVNACLEKPSTCAPELLIKGGGDARRKPVRP